MTATAQRIRAIGREELPAIRQLFANANDFPYDLVRVAEEKCFGPGVAGLPVVRVWGDFAGLAVTCGKYLRILAVDREQRNRGIGSALLADAESRGASVVAAEPGNYFTPGVLESTVELFIKRGYHETAATHNLVCDLESGTAPPLPRRVTHSDREGVLAFIEQHFGRIWRFEVSHAFERELPTVFVIDGVGFAAHEANNRGLGVFGPTGVVPSLRGRGYGKQLLLASLADLHRLGYPQAIIPWTDAIEFYRKSCGARTAARFVTMTRVDR